MIIDKTKELKAEIVLINDKVNFRASVEGNDPISIDYSAPLGDNLGYTSLELLLLSLSSCLGTAILIFLRRMNKDIRNFSIKSHGTRTQEHPTSLNKIELFLSLTSSDTKTEELEKLIKVAEDTYCPVWAMLKGNVEITVKFSLTK